MTKRRKSANPAFDLNARLREECTWPNRWKEHNQYDKDIDELLTNSLERLDNTGHKDAAAAWRTVLQSGDGRQRTVKALNEFAGVVNTKFDSPYDVLTIRDNVIDLLNDVERTNLKTERLHKQFGRVAGVPTLTELREPIVVAVNALIDQAAKLKRMFIAIETTHGSAHGTSPLASQLRGVHPIERFANQLSEIWNAAGLTLLRRERVQFEEMLKVLVEAITGKTDIDCKNFIARIKSQQKPCNSHPPK